jgi:hypothetical protein
MNYNSQFSYQMNIFPLPEFVFAMVPSFLDENDENADLLREHAGNVVFRHKKGNVNFENGVFVSIEGSPNRIIFRDYGSKYAVWLNDEGQIHREDGPAIIEYDEEYLIRVELWVINGVFPIFEDDRPQVITYYKSGNVHERIWCAQTTVTLANLPRREPWQLYKQHHDIHPAVIRYFHHGTIWHEYWYIFGVLQNNNVDAPAHIEYSYEVKGEVVEENWWQNHERYRAGNRPAVVKYGKNRVVRCEVFYGRAYKTEVIYDNGRTISNVLPREY